MTDVDRRFPKRRHWRDRLDPDPLALDDDTADRILRGMVAPDDAPPGYSRVSEVVAALTATPAADETARTGVGYSEVGGRPLGTSTLTSTLTAMRTGAARVHTRRLRVMTATLLSGVVVFGSLAVAGALPSRAQQLAADALDRIGVSVPAPTSQTRAPAVDASGNGTTSKSTTAKSTGTTGGSGSESAGGHSANGNANPTVSADVTAGTKGADRAKAIEESTTLPAVEPDHSPKADNPAKDPTPPPPTTTLPAQQGNTVNDVSAEP